MNTTLFLKIIAAILAVFGLIYLFSPITLATKAGITADNSGLTDIRATYGGIQIGLAVFLYWSSLAHSRLSSALAATAIMFFSVGACRLYGVIVDGEFSGFNMIGLSFEIVLTVISGWLLLRSNQKKTGL